MNASIFNDLRRDWDIAAGWFQPHHQPQPYDEHQQPPSQEEHMPLADNSASLNGHKDALRAALQTLITAGHEALDQHLPLIEQDAADIADAAAREQNSPVVQAALGAAHVPPELLAPIADVLNAYAAAHAKPAEAEPQPEPQPA